MIAPLEVRRPASLAVALELTAAGGTPYCGGTELLAAMKLGLLECDVLVDLKGISELRAVTGDDRTISIGAATTHRELARVPMLGEGEAALVTAVRQLGNARVRAVGTVGGNLCFGEPRSDVATALAALGATVELRSGDGTRRLAVEQCIVGPFVTERHDDELLTSVQVPRAGGPSHYVRFQPGEYPLVSVAIRIGPPVRLVVGAVGGRPQVFERDGMDDLVASDVAAAVDVAVDDSAAEDYKRHLVAVLSARALSWARGRRHG